MAIATRHATDIELWCYTDMTIGSVSLLDVGAIRPGQWYTTVYHSDKTERTYMLTDMSYARAEALCERILVEWRRGHIWRYAGMPMLGF